MICSININKIQFLQQKGKLDLEDWILNNFTFYYILIFFYSFPKQSRSCDAWGLKNLVLWVVVLELCKSFLKNILKTIIFVIISCLQKLVVCSQLGWEDIVKDLWHGNFHNRSLHLICLGKKNTFKEDSTLKWKWTLVTIWFLEDFILYVLKFLQRPYFPYLWQFKSFMVWFFQWK